MRPISIESTLLLFFLIRTSLIQRCINVIQRCFDVVLTVGIDVALTLCKVENSTSDFVSFSASD